MTTTPFQQKIASGVEVPVMPRGTHWTRPLAIRQSQVRFDIAAEVTPFARRKECPDSLYPAAVPCALVFQLAQKLAPPGVADPFGQVMVGQQAFHMQVLDIQRLVFARQSMTLLVQEVCALAGHLLVQTG